MRRAHTKHKDYCTCGKIVRGNGGRASHREMHRRKGDGHHTITREAWCDMMAKQSPEWKAGIRAYRDGEEFEIMQAVGWKDGWMYAQAKDSR